MIQLGCNYSPELMELLINKQVDLDWIKIGDERFDVQFQAVNSLKPVLLHTLPPVAIASEHVGWGYARINAALEQCQSPHVAIHLYVRKNDFVEILPREKLIAKVKELLCYKKARMNTEVLVENMPINFMTAEYSCLADPEVIAEICAETGVGLLLDLSHLKISAWYRNQSELEYLQQLPLDLVREIHVNGPRREGSEYRDTHLDMREEDFTLLETALGLCNPRIVTLEYGKEMELLKNQLQRLAKIREQFQ
ncbi:MAG TPA: DUF692 family protein [Bacillota bacterium]|nr:DUF692 family protein [Bacillota bacterium]